MELLSHGYQDIFSDGVYVIFHAHIMALLCFILTAIHLLKAFSDSGETRKWSRIWKGLSYTVLGVGFVISNLGVMSVDDVRRMLRMQVAIVIITEIVYHIPYFAYLYDERGNGDTANAEWTNI